MANNLNETNEKLENIKRAFETSQLLVEYLKSKSTNIFVNHVHCSTDPDLTSNTKPNISIYANDLFISRHERDISKLIEESQNLDKIDIERSESPKSMSNGILTTKISIAESEYECTKCGTIFDNQTDLKEHLSVHMKISINKGYVF